MNKYLFLLIPTVFLGAATAANTTVPAGGNFQAALNAAKPGDTIILTAGATYKGDFTLPPNPGPNWITIQSSAMSQLPSAGNRVSNSQSAAMPKLMSLDENAVITATTGANYYRFVGIEFLPASGVYTQGLILVGTSYETSIGALPANFDFDRDYIHGDPVAGGKRGIALNGGASTVENCYISGFISDWQDTQAIEGWNGPGPYTIINNYLEAGTETVAFGGAVPSIQGVIPSNILVQHNHFYKPLSWMPWSSNYAGFNVFEKNSLELKFAKHVTIDSNIFENNWLGGGQRGFVLMFTERTEVGQVPWAVIDDVKVTNNVFEHIASGVDIMGIDDNPVMGSSDGFLIQNNLWFDIGAAWGGDGRMFQLLNGANDTTVDHNTIIGAGYMMNFDVGPSNNVNLTNNIMQGQDIVGDGTLPGVYAFNAFAPGNSSIANNVLLGVGSSFYPSNNFFPSSLDQVGFVNDHTGNYQLAANSPYISDGANSTAIGADVAKIGAAVANVLSGQTTGAAPMPTGPVQLIARNSGKCLDVAGISKAPGARVFQWDCWGGPNQQWILTPTVDGSYEITSVNSGLALEVQGGPNVLWNGGTMGQWPYWGGSSQQFQLIPTDSGYYEIVARNSGKCLDVNGGPAAIADGATVQQWDYWGGTNQQWKLVPLN